MRRILTRIAVGPADHREQAVAELMVRACLSRRDGEVKREANRMPVLNDIMKSEVVGPKIRRARAEAGSNLCCSRSSSGLGILDAKRIADVFPR